jgi:hypothetical protein
LCARVQVVTPLVWGQLFSFCMAPPKWAPRVLRVGRAGHCLLAGLSLSAPPRPAAAAGVARSLCVRACACVYARARESV